MIKYKTYIKFIANEKKRFVKMMLLLLLMAFMDISGIGLLLPIFKIMLDGEFLKSIWFINQLESKVGIFILLGIILVLIIFKNLFAIYIERNKALFVYDLFKRYSLQILNSYVKKGNEVFLANDSTVLFKNIYLVPFYFATSVVFASLTLVTEIIVLIILVGAWFIVNPSIFLVISVVAFPFIYVYFRYSKKKTQQLGEQINHQGPEVHGSINDIIFGNLDIEIYQKSDFFIKKYYSRISRFSSLSLDRQMFLIYPMRLVDSIVVFILVTVFGWGILFNQTGEALITILISFGLVAMRSIPSLNKISAAIVSIRGNAYTINLMDKEIEDECILSKDEEVGFENQIIPFTQNVILKNVGFYYPGSTKIVLNNINFEIKKGDNIGIIGESGSGKTTLISILAQLRRQTIGTIYIDGKLLLEKDKRGWQKNIGYVSQGVFILKGTLIENIAFGIENPDLNLVKEAINGASLNKFVNSHTDKENMLINEGGGNLSGGQKQRIAIARALYSKATIFIFDEATSALDNETELEIMESIKALSRNGFTVLIIAHRISTLSQCDRIIELQNGSINSVFNYEELIKRYPLQGSKN